MLTTIVILSIINNVKITYNDVQILRDLGYSWTQVGEHFASLHGGDAKKLKERARSVWRRSKVRRKKTETSNTWEASPSSPTNVSEKELLEQHGYDPTKWEVMDSSCVKRGEVYQSRVKVRPKQEITLDKERWLRRLRDVLGEVTIPPTEGKKSGLMAVVPLYDLHLGRRGSDKSHYDTEEIVMSAISDVVRFLEESKVERIVLPIGQDFLNADNKWGQTTKGTPQDNSLSWHEMLERGLAVAVAIIEELATVAPVEVYYSMGNHDEVLSYAIVQALHQRYLSSEQVIVDPEMRHRVYLQYGANLIGLSHGKEERDLHTIMQVEERYKWGKSDFNYWLVGHLHHLSMKEEHGVTVIRCPSLTFADEWTTRKGYIGSRQSLMVALFDKDLGMREMYFASA